MTPAWLYDLALYLHLLGAFSLVSGTVLAGVGFEVAQRRASCAEIAILLGLARIGAALVVGGTLLAAASGCGWSPSATGTPRRGSTRRSGSSPWSS